MKYKYIIGIDEAGRGPLAGPVAVGAVMFSKEEYQGFKKKNKKELDGRDSKQLTEIQREKWFERIKEDENIRYIVCFTEAKQIDKFGIVNVVRRAINRALKKFETSPNKCKVLLDGTLKAPEEFTNQKTIIKGDEKELIISLASIVAKVKRDRKMINLSNKYPKYNFEKHKGYGTKEHYKKLKKHGVCAIHRKTFLKNLLN